MLKGFAKYGIPGLALFVLLTILLRFNFNFAEIQQDSAAVIAIIGVCGILIVTLVAVILHYISNSRQARQASIDRQRDRERGDEAILLKYNQLVSGLPSPRQNVWAIEEIANSGHPQRHYYLRELRNNESISFIEQDSITLALSSKKKIENTYERLCKKESDKWKPKDKSNIKPYNLWTAIWILKMWRYTNRKYHGRYKDVEEALNRVLFGEVLDEETSHLIDSLNIKDR